MGWDWGKKLSKWSNKIDLEKALAKVLGEKNSPQEFVTDTITSYNKSGTGQSINTEGGRTYDTGSPYTAGVMSPEDGYAARKAKDRKEAAEAEMSRRQAAEENRARMQEAVRIRRRRNPDAASTKGGTLLTGSLGLVGQGSSGTRLGVV